MIILRGHTDARRALGRVADFCPFCRGFRPFRFFQVEHVQSYFLIRAGGRVPIGHNKVCESCKLSSKAEPSNYRGISQDPDAEIESLIVETNPEIRRTWASRMILEDRIKARKLTLGERSTLLREPFDMAEEVLAHRSREFRLDLPSQIGCLGTFLLPTLCLTVLPMAWHASGETIEWTAITLGGLCLALAFLSITSDGRRHARNEILPRLVDSIRPLDPSPEELEALFESFRESRSTIAEVLRPVEVTNALMERWE